MRHQVEHQRRRMDRVEVRIDTWFTLLSCCRIDERGGLVYKYLVAGKRWYSELGGRAGMDCIKVIKNTGTNNVERQREERNKMSSKGLGPSIYQVFPFAPSNPLTVCFGPHAAATFTPPEHCIVTTWELS
jgi:hypothetical protein